MSQIHWIRPGDPPEYFPPDELALKQPDGLLAAGGDLSLPRLLAAYRRGIFPWYEDGQVILWWTPDPRTVLWPATMHVSRSLRRAIRRKQPRISVNTAFAQVIDACAAPRSGRSGTWITSDMRAAYYHLHKRGHAHSLEVWLDGELAGGIYGVAIGAVFFGESMFSAVSDGSKMAIAALAKWLAANDFAVIDGQMRSSHLSSLGCTEMPRREFAQLLNEHCPREISPVVWKKQENLPLGWG